MLHSYEVSHFQSNLWVMSCGACFGAYFAVRSPAVCACHAQKHSRKRSAGCVAGISQWGQWQAQPCQLAQGLNTANFETGIHNLTRLGPAWWGGCGYREHIFNAVHPRARDPWPNWCATPTLDEKREYATNRKQLHPVRCVRRCRRPASRAQARSRFRSSSSDSSSIEIRESRTCTRCGLEANVP